MDILTFTLLSSPALGVYRQRVKKDLGALQKSLKLSICSDGDISSSLCLQSSKALLKDLVPSLRIKKVTKRTISSKMKEINKKLPTEMAHGNCSLASATLFLSSSTRAQSSSHRWCSLTQSLTAQLTVHVSSSQSKETAWPGSSLRHVASMSMSSLPLPILRGK